MKMGSSNDRDAVKAQYASSKSLDIRLNFHNMYSTNKMGFGPWLVEGYEIKEGDKVNLDTSSPKTPIVKIMGLPKNRKFYRNPYIRTSDMMKDEEYYE